MLVKLLKIPIIIRFKIRIMEYGHFFVSIFCFSFIVFFLHFCSVSLCFGCLVSNPHMEKNKRKKNYRLSVLVRLKTQNRLNILSSIVSRIDLNEIAKHLGFIYIDLKWKITEKNVILLKCN